jgi:hypothetical protein
VRWIGTILLGGSMLLAARGAGARTLTFEERVAAQAALERASYAHQEGATRPFDTAVPRVVLEAKVRAYLDESLALERIWASPVTAAALRDELERIVRESRMPDRLREQFAVLGTIPF